MKGSSRVTPQYRTDGKKETGGKKKDGGSAMRTREVQIRVSDPVISRAPRQYAANPMTDIPGARSEFMTAVYRDVVLVRGCRSPTDYSPVFLASAVGKE